MSFAIQHQPMSASTKLHALPVSTISRSPNRKTASSRGISPTGTSRPYSALAAARGMPSPRTSPAMRPTSPLSPGYKTSGHFDTLQPPQQRPPHSRSHSNQQQQRGGRSLRLPSLPRFHPANFPSADSSLQSTPDGNAHSFSPQPPMSPRAYQRMYKEAQRQLYYSQREIFSAVGKPASPRLQPLGSPGPVTPLELEGTDGYLVAGARNLNHMAATASDVADNMVKAEVARQRGR